MKKSLMDIYVYFLITMIYIIVRHCILNEHVFFRYDDDNDKTVYCSDTTVPISLLWDEIIVLPNRNTGVGRCSILLIDCHSLVDVHLPTLR